MADDDPQLDLPGAGNTTSSTGAGGGNTPPVGAGGAGVTATSKEPPKDTPPVTQSISLEEHHKTLARLKLLESERDTLKQSSKDRELQQMKDQEKWKDIAEIKIKEADEANEKTENMSRALQKREKMSSIRSAALQAGLRKDALDLLDLMEFPEVLIEATTLGNINIVGVSTAIEALKLKHPSLFGKKSGNLNGGLPEVVDGGMITIDHLLKAEDKARKSGSADDKAAYAKTNKLYQQQQRRGS